MKKRIQLPIDCYQEEIFNSIKKNPVTIITAETGAGKSTRIPLWYYQNGKKVVVTQPRRIAARSLADYLARTEGVKLGTNIGFQTGFDKKFSKQTSLLYLTDGVQILKEIKGFINYDILIIDEVHEWNLNQEVLIGLVKRKLESGYYQKTGRRVVIMSATIEAKQLSEFFNRAPVIYVEGRGFPVLHNHHSEGFMLSDAVSMVREKFNTLIFLPGKKEINDFIELLKETLKEDKIKAKTLPLHSELSIKDQSKVFEHYSVPKIVVSTDVAQTSLTIDDIDAVIDSGLKKEIRFHQGVEGLYPVEISASESKQRAGRGGRTKEGYYILCSDLKVEERQKFPEPEIHRLNPSSIILRLKKWGFEALNFNFFHYPNRGLIKKAEKKLKIFGALDEKGNITKDGHEMANLPVSIRSSRAIIEALKGSKDNFFNALKLISILEVKGIGNREYTGQKFYKEKFNSDLYNQLFMWNNQKNFKKMISFKKLLLARQIYNELKKRISEPEKVKTNVQNESNNVLHRVILSLFIDFTFKKFGKSYFMDEVERNLDNKSILYEILPEMITGIPFDLILIKQDYLNKEKEENLFPLITFATEISYDLLNDLEPFSYKKKRIFELANDRIRVKESITFGGVLIRELVNEPDFNDPTDKKAAFNLAFRWFRENKDSLRVNQLLAKINKDFWTLEGNNSIKIKLKSFSEYKNNFIKKKIREGLDNSELRLFFDLHSSFLKITLSDLLPELVIKKLKNIGWPEEVAVGNEIKKIRYIKRKPYVNLNFKEFKTIKKDDLIIATGDRANVIFGKKICYSWDEAIYFYNRTCKEDIFQNELKSLRKKVDISDLKNISFPQVFNKGIDKFNKPFEFYVVPLIKDNEVYLIHYFSKENAKAYFNKIEPVWKKFITKADAQELQDSFKFS